MSDLPDPGPFYHGAHANLPTSSFFSAGFRSSYRLEVVMNHVYFAAQEDSAGLAATLSLGAGMPRFYLVVPTGGFDNDPTLTDMKFPGNPTRSYRSAAPLRIAGKISVWVRLTEEEIAICRDKLRSIKGEIIN